MTLTRPMRDLINGYVYCALWSSSDGDNEGLEAFTLAHDAREKLEAFALSFATDNADLIAQAMTVEGYDASNVGHDLWLTQAHHGAGFWDGDLPEALGEALTDAAQKFREYNLYVGDDELVYCD